MIAPDQDAYGQEVYDYFQGETATEIIERNDGSIGLSGGPELYFAPYDEWRSSSQQAIGLAHGRCLDVGCGAGRVSLYLQEQGLEVVGIDNSPLAVKTARLRGVQDARLLSLTQASRNCLGIFDTIIMFGNNFGLFGNARRAHWLLRRFFHMTTADGQILAESLDIYQTDDPDHLAEHERNRQRGRMAGQVRLRVRYKKLKGPWFDYLLVSPGEMRDIGEGAGWTIDQVIQEEEDPRYTAVLKKA